ncbi:MAG TPA: UMP kinase [Clostridiales bacterium]|nr:UMP kinase [Clostridiales bacterium]HPP67579.1 UMP kinase [Clostridiales bacterium]
MEPFYDRVILKLSGEVLAGENGFGYDFEMLDRISLAIGECKELGTQIGIVVGGGNFWRGRSCGEMHRASADNVGMLATAMNAIVLSDALYQNGINNRVMSAIFMPKICEYYVVEKARDYMKNVGVVIFACGTGNPFFSTDSAAALRAAELDAKVVLKGTNVDGVYDKDPRKHPDAVRFDCITHDEVLARGLGVMDAAATAICKENDINTIVFDLTKPENIVSAVKGICIGTIVTK